MRIRDWSSDVCSSDLAAPYVHLANAYHPGSGNQTVERLGMHYADTALDMASQPLIGELTLDAGRLLEVRGGQGLGNGGQQTILGSIVPGSTGATQLIVRPGFDLINLVSGGHLRFASGYF